MAPEMMKQDLTSERVFKKAESIVSRRIAGDLILVPVSGDLANMQRIFSLTPVAELVWGCLDGRCNLGEIRDAVLTRFDVESSQALSDVLSFVEDLVAAKLAREVVKAQ